MKRKATGLLVFAVAAAALCVTSMPLRASEADDRIESSFKNTYVYMTYLKDDAIRIESKDGAVTLTGTVAEDSHKALARETVVNLPGVTRVDNQLTTKAVVAAENADSLIGRKVRLTLLLHRHVNADKTTVEVKDGIVTLRGEASSMAQKELTAEYAKDIEGVKEVKNEMTVGATPVPAKRCGSYVEDRRRDAGDIFTLTTGIGEGAAARVGPIETGLYLGRDYAGLRGGEGGVVSESASLPDKQSSQLDLILYSTERFTPDNGFELARNRGKLFTAEGMALVAIPTIDEFNQRRGMYKGCAPYWTQVEVVAGIGPSFRFGFNVGEFADHLLGFVCIDIYGDDIASTEPAQAERTACQKIDDASVTAQVKTALSTHLSTSSVRTKVETRNGEVTLTGLAKNAAEKSLVTKLVTDIRGVTSVNNQMTVE